MRLGGFVIHGNAIDTLGPCLDDLRAVCDEVVAVDSGSTDGSAALSASRGARVIHHPWEGFGAARAVAVQALAQCEYVFYLDADERLSEGSAERLRQWKASAPRRAYYRLLRRDWAELPNRRFVFRSEWRKRLIRIDAAVWKPEMIVHEALPRGDGENLAAGIEHRFATSIAGRETKNDYYALLWAVLAHAHGQHSPARAPRRLAHWLRNGLLKGAWFRGGLQGVRLSWSVAAYHARKYELLKEVEAGRYRELVEAWQQHQYAALFQKAAEALR